MLQLLNFITNLFLLLPWWGALAVLTGLAAGTWLLGKYLVHRMFRQAFEDVAQQGVALTDALVTVHSVEPADAPTERSEFDSSPDDDDYDPDLDEDWLEDAAGFIRVDATIAPTDPDATWAPANLTLVRGDFQPSELLEACDQSAVLHTLEVWTEGRFIRSRGGEVVGPQHLRMLFALSGEFQEAKFAYHFTYFGAFSLPTTVASGRARV